MATIKDIAKTLNISVSTVSYALNGGPRNVPDEVKARVISTARELGYRPNRNARSLITRRTHAIGVVPSQLGTNIALGPFFRESLNGIINESEILQYDVVLFTRCDQVEADAMLNNVLDGRVDGLIFLAPPIQSPVVDLVVENGLPVAVTGAVGFSAPCFTADNASGVDLALNHLVELGHKRIGHLKGKPFLDDSRERYLAYERFMLGRSLPLREEWILDGDFTAVGGFAAGIKMLSLDKKPTAVFCANDEMAIGLIRAARELGIAVPKQLSVVGFDDSSLCDFSFPTLTSVCQPMEAIAVEALRSVVKQIEVGARAKSIQFPTKLTVRASTSRPLEDHH